MAKEGKKLELYEILAAKRAKGKVPFGPDAPTKQANAAGPAPEVITDGPGLIIDDAVIPAVANHERKEAPRGEAAPSPAPVPAKEAPPPAAQPEPALVETPIQPAPFRQEQETPRQVPKRGKTRKILTRAPQPAPAPEYVEPEPRPRSPREVVFALDTALIFFTVILALIGSSYFIGYKRGQEEKPAGLIGMGEIEVRDPSRIMILNLDAEEHRTTIHPPEQDYTLIIRKEPATDNNIPERLKLELAEALLRGKQQSGKDVPGFIFRTAGSDPHFILAVGLGQNVNDQGLNELLQVYYAMDGVTLSREPKPYRGCRIAPVRELGTPVY